MDNYQYPIVKNPAEQAGIFQPKTDIVITIQDIFFILFRVLLTNTILCIISGGISTTVSHALAMGPAAERGPWGG